MANNGNTTTLLSTALTTLRSMLDEPTGTSGGFWSDAQLTSYLNMGQDDVQRKSEALQVSTTFDIDANTQKYSLTGLTDQLFRNHRLEYTMDGGTQIYPCEFRGYNEMDAVWGTFQSQPSSFPSYYTLWNNPPQLQVIFYPTPASDGNGTLYYFRQTRHMVVSGDTVDCLPGYEDVIYDYAAYRALRQDADPRWKDQFDMYNQNLNDMISMSRTFQDQANYFTPGQQNYVGWLMDMDY